ncbi:MAG: rod shape-determining protein MreC [Rhodospirillales bacterium]
MKQPTGQISRLGTFKYLAQRFAFLSLIGLTFALMLIGKADTVIVERVSMAVSDAVTPILRVMAEPAASISKFVTNVQELGAIREQNTDLREINARLLEWQAVAQKLENENRQLRALLGTVNEPEARAVSARVVADYGGAFAQSVLITAGGRDGVAKGQAVVTGEGLTGRVAQAGYRSARVLLITDINSRIPVRVGEAGDRAILTGNNSPRPRLIFLGVKSAISPGDRVVTSGDAGAFPPGLPVGRVVVADESSALIEPFVSRDRLQYVEVLDFGLTGFLADTDGPQ